MHGGLDIHSSFKVIHLVTFLSSPCTHDICSDLTPMIPLLISLLIPTGGNDAGFIAASDVLQEILSKSALSDGSGSKTLTEPLLLYLDIWGSKIVEATLESGIVEETSHSLCKLLTALGDHSTQYFAAHLASSAPISPPDSSINFIASSSTSALPTKGQLSQTFMRLLLAYTGLPGFYGEDEEESEMTLGFWYLFQEALWSTDYYFEDDLDEDGDRPQALDKEGTHWAVAKALYSELVQVLRRKSLFPPSTHRWVKGAYYIYGIKY